MGLLSERNKKVGDQGGLAKATHGSDPQKTEHDRKTGGYGFQMAFVKIGCKPLSAPVNDGAAMQVGRLNVRVSVSGTPNVWRLCVSGLHATRTSTSCTTNP